MKWWINRWKVSSSTTSDQYYTVAENDEGGFGCDCPLWKFRRIECHHIQFIKRGLESGTIKRKYTLEEYLKLKGTTVEDFKYRKMVDEL